MKDQSADDWSTPSYGGSGTRTGGSGSPGASPADSDWSETRTRGTPKQDAPPPPRRPQQQADGERSRTAQRPVGRAYDDRGRPRNPPTTQFARSAPNSATDTGEWAAAGPVSSRQQRATRAADRQRIQPQRDARAGARGEHRRQQPAGPGYPADRGYPDERGYPVDRRGGVPEKGAVAWVALAVMVGITLVGALIDSVGSFTGQDAFNVAIILGSLVAVLIVRRSHLFWVMVAPPLVYGVIAVIRVYVKSSNAGKHGATSAIIDTVQDYLTFGFLALAIATGVVIVIGGIRLLNRR